MRNEMGIDDSSVFSVITKIVSLLSDKNSISHLRVGYWQRALQLKEIHLHLSKLIKLNGKEKRDPYETTETNIFLNAFYVNLFGGLDNLAWSLQHELKLIEGASESNSSKFYVTLFHKKFIKQLRIFDADLCDRILSFKPWYDEAKRFRDPAAHRIPLTVPTGILTDEYKEEYDAAVKEFEGSDYNTDPEGYMNAMRKQHSVGEFLAAFISYSENQNLLFPLEKTIGEDYGPFWELSELVLIKFYELKLRRT